MAASERIIEQGKKRWRTLWTNGILWFLLSLVVFLTINNIVWLKRHLLTIPPQWDQAIYLYMSLRYLHALSDAGLPGLFKEFLHAHPYAAPLFPLTTMPLYLMFGPSRLVAHLTNSFFLFLLLLGSYLLGKHVYRRRTGILASLIISTFTAIVIYSRDYLMDFPSAVVATLGIYALIRSEEFRHRAWCLLFGVLVGLALLTKTMAGVFFVGPSLYAFGCLLRQRQLTLPRLKNLLLSVTLAVLVAAVWWGPKFQTALGFLIYGGFGEGSIPYRDGESDLLTLKNLSYYLLALANDGTSFLYAVLFAGCILSGAVMKVYRRRGADPEDAGLGHRVGYLWAWLLIGYGILTAVPLKWERFAQALLPPLAVLLAGYIGAINTRWLRISLAVVAIIIGTFNYLAVTYETQLIPQVYYVPPFSIASRQYVHYSRWMQSTLQPSSTDPWPIDDVLAQLTRLQVGIGDKMLEAVRSGSRAETQDLTVEEYVWMMYRVLLKRDPGEAEFRYYVEALRNGQITRAALIDTFSASSEFRMRPAKILVVPDHPEFNPATLQYYAELRRHHLSFSRIFKGPIHRDQLQAYDFALVKEGGYQGPDFANRYNDQILAELLMPNSGFVALPQAFAFPPTVAFPEPSHIRIFAATYVFK
jgi:4-amino-4-deoxy-L-arabinose transferase-like glycosyltransferase